MTFTIPSDAGLQLVCLHTEKRAQHHEQKALLLRGFPHLGLYNAAALLDAPMVEWRLFFIKLTSKNIISII